MLCIHDSEIISYSFDLEKQILDFVVNIVFPEDKGQKAKISFSGVIFHEIKNISYQNVIFDIDKTEASEYFKENKNELKKNENFVFSEKFYNFTDLQIEKYLKENEIFVYTINSSVWLDWLVFAKNMEIIEIPSD